MKYVLALDQGTTSSRAILFDEEANIVSLAQKEFEQHFPRNGWVEHDAETIWSSQVEVARDAIDRVNASPKDIAAIGIANQRETVVVWDRATSEPVGRAIVWQDRRTSELCDELAADGCGDLIRERTGLVIDPYFSSTKLKWLLDSSPDVRRRAEAGELAFGTVESWLVWRLTKGRVHVTDASNASRTQLLGIEQANWDDELLELFGVPRELLPTVVGNCEVVGEADLEWFGRAIPIAGLAGDQQAALFGQVCFEPGLAKNTYGTGCFALTQTGSEFVTSQNRLLTSIAWQVDDRIEYALEGSVFVAGAAVQWLRDGLGIIERSADVERLAASVKDSGGVSFVPAFTGLGAPYWDPRARGTLTGLSRGTTRAHIARATLEGIVHQSTDVLEAMATDRGGPVDELRVDGGAARNDLLMQLQADLLGTPVVRPKLTETTAFGAAALAGLAVGFWNDRNAIVDVWSVDRRFEPCIPKVEIDARREAWRDAVARASGNL